MLPIADDTPQRGRDAYREGVAARGLGVARRDCPYPPGAWRQIDWLVGWNDEDQAIAANEVKSALRPDRAAL